MVLSKRKISHFVVLGDSLSDRGMLWDRDFLGVFHLMRDWSGLVGSSPDKRFTNGYVWVDYLAEEFAKKFIEAEQLRDNPDLYLQDDQRINLRGHDFFRSFAEGGVAAFQFIFRPLTTFVGFITRLILRTLRDMRDLLLLDDEAKRNNARHKEQTLVIDWTGANDLITVNQAPCMEAVELAVKSRIKNAKKLIKEGYQNFMLFDLPDLSLVPRFQNLPGEEGEAARKNAKACIEKFNELQREEAGKLNKLYPQCQVDVYDINDKFKDIYNDPVKYGFKEELLKTPFKGTPGSQPVPGQPCTPAPGFMFNDDMHPTTATHEILAGQAQQNIETLYEVVDPNLKHRAPTELTIEPGTLINIFKEKYTKIFDKDRFGFFGEKCHSNIKYRFKHLSLEDIFDHALNHGGNRTNKVLQKLGWLDSYGKLRAENVIELKRAYERAMEFAIVVGPRR